ncbi:MFS transporter [Sinomonas atrocyanea]|uniref:MFS transporter n=1 Tax=Sinomonas atrocyanea TaxID=37927 RepID=A0A127A5P2_9MICC|nr:MFS transporter [Sinomonas atrocyanea]AMM34094.1 MFS transporter [Sinomonas atrocyanea]GEB65127.1 putative transporter YybO [Sinomonas atrocyanea]GGG58824.1 putative transporter YybO [Sinomonas atrocyanea]
MLSQASKNTHHEPAVKAVRPRGKARWSIALLMGFGILINYVDRLSISVTQGPLTKEFGLTAIEFGVLSSAFLWSYAIMQIPSGMLLDRFGVKKVWGASAVLWTVASVLTAIASGAWVIVLARVFLGVAEAPAFPGAMKATGLWFPRHERGLCTAIFDSGTRLANVLGLPLIAFTVATWGWREAFWLQAVLSLVFLGAFLWRYTGPKHKLSKGSLSAEEYRYIIDGGATSEDVRPASDWSTIAYLLRQRKVWGLSLGLAGAGYVLWMLLTWLPGYMQTSMNQSVLQSGIYAAVPALAMFVSELTIGGWWVDRVIGRGANADKVRKGVLVAGMIVALFTVGAAFSNSPIVAITWIAIGSAGIALVYVTSNSLPALIAPEGSAGSLAAIVNCVNLLAGVAAPIVTGFIVDATGHFVYAFIIGGVALVGGLASYLLLMGRIEPIPAPAVTVAAED